MTLPEATANNIGRLLKSTSREFSVAYRVAEADMPHFGTFVKAPAQQNSSEVIGLIYNIIVEDDPLVKQMVAGSGSMSEDRFENYVLDNRERRKVPIEVSVLMIGYKPKNSAKYFQTLPPQPPITLDKIYNCTGDEIRVFTQSLSFLRLIVNTPDEIPSDDLLIVSLQQAASKHQPDQNRFLLDAGKELARLLQKDLLRLETLIREITP